MIRTKFLLYLNYYKCIYVYNFLKLWQVGRDEAAKNASTIINFLFLLIPMEWEEN